MPAPSAPQNTKDYQRTIRRQEREGSPKCYYCDTDENITVEHFLLSCSKYEEIRSELLGQLRGELEAIGERGFQVCVICTVVALLVTTLVSDKLCKTPFEL